MNLFDFSNIQPGYAASSQRSQLNPFGAAIDITGGVKMANAPYAPGTTQEQANIMQQSFKTPSVETPLIDQNKLKGMSDEEIDMIMEAFITDGSKNIPNEKPKEESFMKGVENRGFESFKSGIETIKSGAERIGQGEIASGLVRGASGAIETAFSPISGLIGETVSTATPESVKKGLEETIAPLAKQASQWYETLPQDQKERLKDIGAASNVLLSFVGGKVAPEISKNVVKTAEPIIAQGAKKTSEYGKSVLSKIEGIRKPDVQKGINEIYEAVNPTKAENKAILKQRAEDLVEFIDEKKPFNNELATVKQRVDEARDTAFRNMEDYETNVGVKGTAKTKPIIEEIEKNFKKTTKTGVLINEDVAKQADSLIEKLKQFGSELKDDDILTVRREWDDIIKKNKGFMQTADANTKAELYNTANKAFRDAIRKSNPEYAAMLDRAHRTMQLSDVLDATILRKTGQTRGGFIRQGLENVARAIGIAAGLSTGGAGVVIGPAVTEGLIRGVSKLTGPSVKLTKGKKLIQKSSNNITEPIISKGKLQSTKKPVKLNKSSVISR